MAKATPDGLFADLRADARAFAAQSKGPRPDPLPEPSPDTPRPLHQPPKSVLDLGAEEAMRAANKAELARRLRRV
jgi:hypothetical protein